MRGKKVAANTSAEITLSGLLDTQNMSEKDIDYLNLGPTEMAPALANGDVEAACVWQPLLDGLKKAAPDGRLLGLDTDTTTYQKFGTMASPDIVIISRKLVEQHPEQARGIALGMLKGADYTLSNPEDTAKTVAHYFRKTPEEVLAGMKPLKFFGTKDWQQHMKLHTAQMQYLVEAPVRMIFSGGNPPFFRFYLFIGFSEFVGLVSGFELFVVWEIPAPEEPSHMSTSARASDNDSSRGRHLTRLPLDRKLEQPGFVVRAESLLLPASRRSVAWGATIGQGDRRLPGSLRPPLRHDAGLRLGVRQRESPPGRDQSA